MSAFPDGWSYDSCKGLGGKLKRMVNAYEASVGERFDRYALAQRVYDDKEVMSSLDFLEDYTPYNVPLTQIRVRGLVQNVCGGYTSMSPYWVVKGGKSEEWRNAAEDDLTKAFEMANFDLKVRQMGYVAALKARGPARLTYQTIREGAFGDTQGAGTGMDDVVYSGLVLDPIRAERFVLYPTYAPTTSKALLVGHWFEESAIAIREKQMDGEYCDEWDPTGSDDGGLSDDDRTPTIVDDLEEAQVRVYDTLVYMAPLKDSGRDEGQGTRDEEADDDDSEEGGSESEPDDKDDKSDMRRRWFRVIWAYTSEEILRVEEYEDPTPNYFAPAFEEEIDEFFPEHSPATRLLELQAIVNDAISLKIFGGAQNAFLTVLASGWLPKKEQTVRLGIGQLVAFEGNPTFTALPSKFDPRGTESAAQDAERYADGVSGSSQMAQGQALKGDQTATEAGILAAGTSASMSEQRLVFGSELVRMAKYGLYLLGENYKEWRKFNGETVKAKSAKAYQDRYTLEINGKSAGNNPQVTTQKVKALMEAAAALGIRLDKTQLTLNPEALFDVVMNSLEFHVSTARIVNDPAQQPEVMNEDRTSIPEPGSVAEALGLPGGGPVDPGLLAALAQGPGAGALPAGVGGIPPVGPVGGALPPELLGGLPPGL